MCSTGLTPRALGGRVLAPCGQSRDASWINSTGSGIFEILRFLPGISSNACAETGRVNTVSGSTISFVCAFAGIWGTPMKSRSRTTTRGRRSLARRTPHSRGPGRRLPRHRPPTPPGEMLLEEFLRPLGVSQSAFAIHLGVSFPRLNEIIHGKRAVTPDTALRLERVLGMPADFWLGLQTDCDLWQAMNGREAAAIARLQPFRNAG